MQTSLNTPVSSSLSTLELSNDESTELLESCEFYEVAISADETIASNYWYLGVSYLLAGREDEAQPAWFVPLSVATEAEVAAYTDELLEILERQAAYQVRQSALENAWTLRQHIWMLAPERVENILHLIVIANFLERLTLDLLVEWQIEELLETVENGSISDNLLEYTISALLQNLRSDLNLKLTDRCLQLTGEIRHAIVPKLIATAFQIFHQENLGFFAVKLVEICRDLIPEYRDIYPTLAGIYSGINLHPQAIESAEKYYQIATNKFEKLFASYLIQRAYLTAGNWDGSEERLIRHRELVNEAIDMDPASSRVQRQSLIVSSYFSLFIEDNPRVNRSLQNRLAAYYQATIDPLIYKSEFEELSLEKKPGVLRIGYLASTLKEHSVGWLSRWLIHYHDRESFQTFAYCVNQSPNNEFNHRWFRDKVNISYYFNNNAQEIAAQIKADEIDILIDLDSLTFDVTCMVMAHKPAPIQATWLGLDASGNPAIDYFIVDPYVLPDDAQEYYQEKLWRLPQTYLAVDGFEVGIPTHNRQDLDIPDDAVVYFSSQGGYKRHPDNIRCQIKIIKDVPNSYLLIKGKSDPDMIRNLFGKICEEEGVDLDRLRFLGSTPDEYTHRANLAIADIVLDTFPYNGATTTLETLWMGIPMVTRVGEQFASRNSYTFMLNAGIEEGIAWSEAEYIEWGVKLGLDRELRWQVQGKLRSGRTTAPVWNAKQFTLDMEQAYREMWAKYQELDTNSSSIIDLHSNN